MKNTICCPKCEGRGQLSLDEALPHLDGTLAILRESGPHSAMQMHEKIGGKNGVGATYNRLRDLCSLGFVTRRWSGGVWVYSAVQRDTE